MIINIPPIECYIRAEYLYNREKHHDTLLEGSAFAVKSIQGQALIFTVMVDNGAVYDGVPISALVAFTKKDAKHIPFHVLQLWDCFSYSPYAVQFMFLKNKRCMIMMKTGERVQGIYRFTIDWDANASQVIPTSYAEEPSQHKMLHVIELETGQFAAYPNNRILWSIPGMTDKPFEVTPDYSLNLQLYSCESHNLWATDETDSYFYKTSEEKPELPLGPNSNEEFINLQNKQTFGPSAGKSLGSDFDIDNPKFVGVTRI